MHMSNFDVSGPKFARFVSPNAVDQIVFRLSISSSVAEIFAIEV